MLSLDELHELLGLGHETRSFEVKGPGSAADKHLLARVARVAMAMANLRDGGTVCIGIDDKQIAELQPGLKESDLDDWADFDVVSARLAPYCDPPVAFHPAAFTLASGARVVVLDVTEFETTPHVCKRSYQDVLHDGKIYVRPRGKPESVPVPSSAEMRELLDLAVTKGVREFLRRASAAGLSIGDGSISMVENQTSRYEAEQQVAWESGSDVLAAIAGAGHIDIAVRPGTFDPSRLSPGQLDNFLAENTVRLRGWPVPYVDLREPIKRYGTWIAQDVEPSVVPHLEAWRLCTSGQFLHRRVLATDLRDSEQLAPTQPNASGTVAVWDLLLYSVELAEFGARMATALSCDSITFLSLLRNMADRELIYGDWNRELHGPYVVSADEIAASRTIDRTALLADPPGEGVRLTQALLQQFGLDVPDQLLRDWQDQVFGQ